MATSLFISRWGEHEWKRSNPHPRVAAIATLDLWHGFSYLDGRVLIILPHPAAGRLPENSNPHAELPLQTWEQRSSPRLHTSLIWLSWLETLGVSSVWIVLLSLISENFSGSVLKRVHCCAVATLLHNRPIHCFFYLLSVDNMHRYILSPAAM